MSDVTSTSITLTAHFNTGVHDGTERLESWLRDALGGAWYRGDDTPIAGVSALTRVLATLNHPGTPYDLACRITKGGVPQSGHTSPDPLDWPLIHRQLNIQLPLDDPTIASHIVVVDGGSGDLFLWIRLERTPSDQNQLEMAYEAEIADGIGGWTALVYEDKAFVGSVPPYVDVAFNVQVHTGLTRDVRIRRTTAYIDGSWATEAGVVIP